MRRITAIAMTLVMTGCAAAALPGLYFPIYGPMNGFPSGELAGTLIEEDGCLWVESGPFRSLILWPRGARVVDDGGVRAIHDGGNVAIVGEPVRMGGGEYSNEHYAFVVDLIGEEVPPACREAGLYFLGYEARTVEGLAP